MGGVISWAVEPSDFLLDEGFEVNLRAGTGLSETSDVPERCASDFVLSFRRGEKTWHFTAGRRVRPQNATAPTKKTISDRTETLGRQMFWAACLESRTDGRQYVIVGTIPGLISNHFFVAKFTQSSPLTRAGFSYLPIPKHGVDEHFNAGEETRFVLIDSITIYPHTLTGELPFISLRFVEQCEAGTSTSKIVSYSSSFSEFAKYEQQGKEEQQKNEDGGNWELCIRKIPLPVEDAVASRLECWHFVARSECGILPTRDEETAEDRLERKARRRVQPQVVGPNPLTAPSSWEPGTTTDAAQV